MPKKDERVEVRPSMSIDKRLWKDFQKLAIDKDISTSELLVELVHGAVAGK